MKFLGSCHGVIPRRSPSTRREWIEITFVAMVIPSLIVSLHTEGVD